VPNIGASSRKLSAKVVKSGSPTYVPLDINFCYVRYNDYYKDDTIPNTIY